MSDADKTAWMFPGQGSQFVGMGRDLADEFPAARGMFDKLLTHLRDRAQT